LLKTIYRVLRFGLSRPKGGRVDRRAKVELFEQIRHGLQNAIMINKSEKWLPRVRFEDGKIK
jgi:hypothetical protein